MERHEGQSIADESHVLAESSGNARMYSNEDNKPKGYAQLSSRVSSEATIQRYPAPTTTLRSNDHRIQSQYRLKTRRLKKRAEAAKRCWQHPSYIKYQKRDRKDCDKNHGDVIWPDDVERAFRNAVINIPAMGKSKKSQNGKACGRNELIREWILQETGKERERKQVSSHIQVFDAFFRDVPEWKALNKVSKNSNAEDIIKDDEYEYYSNSIADMVRVWKVLSKRHPDFDSDSESEPERADLLTRNISLSRLYFEMWISQPEKIDQILHRYTQVQCEHSTAPPELLESIRDWRTSWPDLIRIIETTPPHEKFELILLEASYHLKDDFPPPKSKLGISLELEFSSSSPDRDFFAIHTPWRCISHFYHKGKLEAHADHKDCHSLGPGKVEPPFESKWWAEKFVQLTKKHLQALDSGVDATVATSDESTRDYLRNLKVMQQISMGPEGVQSPQELWYKPSGVQRPMAILLWSFTQTTEKYVGVTTWKRLIPPPRRKDINSPSITAVDISLPSFNMDSAMDVTVDENLFSIHANRLVPTLPESSHSFNAPENGYVTQHITAQPPNDTETIDQSYHKFSYVDNVPLGFQHILDLQDIHQRSQGSVLHNSCQPMFQPHPTLSSNYFEAQEQWSNDQHLSDDNQYQHHQHEKLHHMLHSQTDEEYAHRQPLLNFDMSTHALLQAQLEVPPQDMDAHVLDLPQQPTLYQYNFEGQPQQIQAVDHQVNIAPVNEQAFDANDHIYLEFQRAPTPSCQNHEGPTLNLGQPELVVPAANRPTLHHHHSFAGLPNYETAHTGLSLTSRNELALLLEGFDSNHKESQAHDLPPVPHEIHGLGLIRPHSQPPPLDTAVEDSMHHNAENLHATGQSLSQDEWVEVKSEV